jgi:hypothetical protein
MATRDFCVGWGGDNCQLGGQAILSLTTTESLQADYDSGAALCLAPEGKLAKGADVEAVEGGTSTGWWTIEDSITLRSGSQTLAYLDGVMVHIPLVKYTLRRKNWQKARTTISKATCPNYPPRFCSDAYYNAMMQALVKKMQDAYKTQSAASGGDQKAVDEANKGVAGAVAEWQNFGRRIHVDSPARIADAIASWVGLPHFGFSLFSAMPDTYEPMGKTVWTALKEIAGWSGYSLYLDRNGTAQVYDYASVMSSGSIPAPAEVMDEEYHDALYPTTAVTVIGTAYAAVGQGHWDMAQTPPAWVPWDPTQDTVGGIGARPVEETEGWTAVTGDGYVEQRIEIKDYPITEELAAKLAHEQIAPVILEAGMVKRSGPAEGCQGIHPLSSRVFSISRNLEWADGGYKYEITIEAPGSDMSPWTYVPDPEATIPGAPTSGPDYGNIPINTLRGFPDPVAHNTDIPSYHL